MKNLIIALIVLFIIFVVPKFVVRKVRVNEVGVLSSQLGGGVEQRDLGPGFHLVIPGIHRLQILDPTLQYHHMTPERDTADPLRIVGKDQKETKLDITIPYRIIPGEAHRVATEIGAEMIRVRERVRTAAGKTLWEALGGLDAKDFYNPELRAAKAALTEELLNTELKSSHIQVEAILIRNVDYDAEFEKLLLQKQLLDQQRELNVALQARERELAETQRIEKETIAEILRINEKKSATVKTIQASTDKALAEIEAEANKSAKTTIAQAERQKREMVAEGEFLRTQAQAEGEKAVNKAYEGFGGDLYIVRQMIDNIQFGNIEINTNQTNPFDVNQMLEMFGVPEQSSKE